MTSASLRKSRLLWVPNGCGVVASFVLAGLFAPWTSAQTPICPQPDPNSAGGPCNFSNPPDCPPNQVDACDYIDVMVVYTTLVAEGNPGPDDDIEDPNELLPRVLAAVAFANQGLSEGRTCARFRLVGLREVPYREAQQDSDWGINTILRKMKTSAAFQPARDWRDTVAADMLCLIYWDDGSSFLGVGNSGVGRQCCHLTAKPSNGVCAVHSSEVGAGNNVFRHELGHTLGLAHHDGTGVIPFGRGKVHIEGPFHPCNFATAMVNLPLTTVTPIHYSNPRIIFNPPTCSEPTGDVDDRDAVRAINIALPVLSRLRVRDCNANGTPDHCEPLACRAAAIAPPQNVVTLADLALLKVASPSSVGDTHYNPCADLDDDGLVNGRDLNLLLSVFGQTCPP